MIALPDGFNASELVQSLGVMCGYFVTAYVVIAAAQVVLKWLRGGCR